MHSSSTTMYVSAPSKGADIIPKNMSNSQATVKLSQHRTLYAKEFLALWLFCRFISSKLAQNSSISNFYSEGGRFKSGSNY